MRIHQEGARARFLQASGNRLGIQSGRGSAFEGDRWATELGRLESARRSKGNVRIGGYSGKGLWVARDDWDPPDKPFEEM